MKRYDLIDTLRGLAVISMIGFHACWIMSYFGLGIPQEALFGTGFTVWERTICISFITIAGFSFSYGRRHVRSGLILLGAGFVITAVTCLIVPDIKIIFGILTFLGTATFLMIPIDKAVRNKYGEAQGHTKKTDIAFFILCLALYVLTYGINKGYLGIRQIFPVMLPRGLYRGYIATFLGFMDPGFYSSDYFSIMPWFFLYLSGYFLHRITGRTKAGESLLTRGIPGIKMIGRHSLIIYIVHPVVLFFIVWIWVRLFAN